jgi:hypothetical protein
MGRRVEGDDRAALGLEAQWLYARNPRHLVGPGSRGIDHDRRGPDLSAFGRDPPLGRSMLDPGNALAGVKRAAAGTQLPQIALQQRVRIEPDAVAVGDTMTGVFPEQRAQPVDALGVEPLEADEQGEFGVERIERLPLILPRMD